MSSVRPSLSILLTIAISACGLLPVGQQAPDRCAFPEGTALEFAGRATTAQLGVEEVPGDPLSDEPADIVITRDEFTQGELRGRLVCVYYVNQDFVEVTIHPDDLEPVVEGPEPPVPAPADGISEAEAVAAARDAIPDGDQWTLAVAEAGPIEQVMYGAQEFHDWARDLPPDLWVWRVFLHRNNDGADVILDFVDGSVHGIGASIVN